MDKSTVVERLLARHGQTYAEAAGIRLKDKPAPLWQLLVLSQLLSTRIAADIAVDATRELFAAGYRTPQRMREASWQDRVDALGRGGYRRYDESTATRLGEMADAVIDDYRGDLRRLRVGGSGDSGDSGDSGELERALQRFKGIGPAGARIFCREVQGVWPELAPYVDDLAADGAERLGLPRTPERLSDLVDRVAPGELPRLVAACVRAARDDAVVADVRRD